MNINSNPPLLPAETGADENRAFFYSKNSPTTAANRIPNAIADAQNKSIAGCSLSLFGSVIFNAFNHSQGSRANGCPCIVM